MRELFETTTIKGLELRNRFVRSATWQGLATEAGAVTPRLIDALTALARGGVGLIVSGHAYVHPEGQATPRQLGAYHDDLVPGLRALTAAVHTAGGRIVLQLAHAGGFAPTALTGKPAWTVSDVTGLPDGPRRTITRQDIALLAEAFAGGARRAQAAGFDGVQLHAAHGYLLSQFLSPAFNRRTDDYGGDRARRVRILLEVLAAVRQAVGPDYPVLIKLNGRDYVEDGLAVEDSLAAAQALAAAGLDAVELSGGHLRSVKFSPSRPGITSVDKEAYFQEEARAFKQALAIPLILVGGIRSFEVAQRLVHEGVADYVSMCRPFIREPDLIRRWQNGDRRKAACNSDNRCFAPGFEGAGVHCVTAEREARKSGPPDAN